MKFDIDMTATYDTVEWEDGDEEPIIGGGFTDPCNPWGGFKQELPEELVGTPALKQWLADNVTTVHFDTLWEAAEFVADFPGGVWDLHEGSPETDYRTGVATSVTLHVENHAPAVHAIAKLIETMRDRRLRTLANLRG